MSNVVLPVVTLEASAQLPTRFGAFKVLVFTSAACAGVETVVLVHGDPREHASPPLVRVHSECLTGDVLGSLRCDCAAQLEEAMRRIGGEPSGVVVYLRQEGRGTGLTNMIQAYSQKPRILDAVDADHALAFDERDYALAASVLGVLAISSVRLMTNNPEKVRQLTAYGLEVTREPIAGREETHDQSYRDPRARGSGQPREATADPGGDLP